jgi:Lon protease-like protein
MFPLGTVLVPGGLLPLHVFEPRYRRMVADCLAGDRRFGVVLIERGSEVGGGDVRTDVGTMARIVQAEEAPDGRWGLVALGVERIRVDAWLPDDPYPRAETSEWPDEVGEVGEVGDTGGPAEVGEATGSGGPGETGETGGSGHGGGGSGRAVVLPLLRRAAALARELGLPAAPLDLELDDDPVVAGYQAIAVAPLGPADRQRLLVAPSVAERWVLLRSMLTDQIELLDARLAHGG